MNQQRLAVETSSMAEVKDSTTETKSKISVKIHNFIFHRVRILLIFCIL